MTAEIINIWIERTKRTRAHGGSTRHFGNELYNKNCDCPGCVELFSGMQRSSQEIMNELRPLRMTGEEDEPKRRALIDELRANSDPLNW